MKNETSVGKKYNKLTVLEIKSGGKGYMETPIVELIEEGLESQTINGKCVFCCKK